MRKLRHRNYLAWGCICLVLAPGCTRVKQFSFADNWDSAPSYHTNVATKIEYPNVRSELKPEVAQVAEPLRLDNPADIPSREIELNEAIRMALTGTDILRSLGGSVVNQAALVGTNFDPAIVESNPIRGVEGALAAFDAEVAGQLFWQKNNRPINGAFVAFQAPNFEQSLSQFNYEIGKRTATGARFAARHSVLYDYNNSPVRQAFGFPSDFTGWFEAEYRQPLLYGAGVDFNRIAGPEATVGNYNGVRIARVRTDISLADFEANIINFIRDVETAYWELYYSYHRLEALVFGRNAALRTWQRTKALQDAGARDGTAADVAQVESQYYDFDALVTEALSGPGGLYQQEQQLRYLLGLPPTDGTLLKPITEPMEGEVIYDWSSSLSDALLRRVEIRRQKWVVKQRELELIAARLGRKPTLDFLALYRYRGLGDHLIGSRDPGNSFESMYQSIFEGDYQEWQAGIEFGYPVGLRRATAAITNARWNLSKEQAVLEEQELRISHDLSNAARQLARSHKLLSLNFSRQASDRIQERALLERYLAGLDNINFYLQAQQAVANSRVSYYRSLVDYQLAIRDFHFQKGSLLNYNSVGLSEGPWPGGAYQDAAEHGRFLSPRLAPGLVEGDCPDSEGCFDPSQVGAGMGGVITPVAAPGQATFAPAVSSEAEITGDSVAPLDNASSPSDRPSEG